MKTLWILLWVTNSVRTAELARAFDQIETSPADTSLTHSSLMDTMNEDETKGFFHHFEKLIGRLQPVRDLYTRHRDQMEFKWLVQRGHARKAFAIAEREGSKLFRNEFIADSVFGGGSNVGQRQRYSRVPRADLKGSGEWANHFPARATGPNGQSCLECHIAPVPGGAGFSSMNVIRDPLHAGAPSFFINRATPHLFGQGAIQLLAEEMTDDLHKILEDVKRRACRGNFTHIVIRALLTKGANFGQVSAQQVFHQGEKHCKVRTSEVQGVDTDLVVRPFEWKGVVESIRNFNRGASFNEMGLEGVELVGDGVDGDGDRVVDELSVGDLTAMTVYVAALPRPTTKQELAEMGKIERLEHSELRSIDRGERVFHRVGCADCHIPEMKLMNSVFSEPSQSPYYRDLVFPAGQNPIARGLDPAYPIQFDLTETVVGGLFPFEKSNSGMTRVQLFSDLKRHDLGAEDAESIDASGTGKSVWLTKALWGLGSRDHFMHDGRATTLSQALDSHGGEAAFARAFYQDLSLESQRDLENYLKNLRLYNMLEKND